jgi:hypothetical protein
MGTAVASKHIEVAGREARNRPDHDLLRELNSRDELLGAGSKHMASA